MQKLFSLNLVPSQTVISPNKALRFSGFPAVFTYDFQSWIVRQCKAYDEGDPAFISPAEYQECKATVSSMLTELWGRETVKQLSPHPEFSTHLLPPSLESRQTQQSLKRIQAYLYLDFLNRLTQRLPLAQYPTSKTESIQWLRSVMNGFIGHLDEKTKQFMTQHASTWPQLRVIDPIEWVDLPLTGFEAKKPISATITNKHLMFMDDNGQVAIYKLPTPQEVLKMVQFDTTLQQFIERKPPLKRKVFSASMLFPPERPKTTEDALSYTATLALLQGPISIQLPNGQTKTLSLQNRTYGNGWSDIHTLLHYCPFDFQRYITEGIWKPHILFELHRPNSPSIWEAYKTASAT